MASRAGNGLSKIRLTVSSGRHRRRSSKRRAGSFAIVLEHDMQRRFDVRIPTRSPGRGRLHRTSVASPVHVRENVAATPLTHNSTYGELCHG